MITGQEHHAQMRLPNGFEYREAETANGTWLKVPRAAIAFQRRNTDARLTALDWSNGQV